MLDLSSLLSTSGLISSVLDFLHDSLRRVKCAPHPPRIRRGVIACKVNPSFRRLDRLRKRSYLPGIKAGVDAHGVGVIVPRMAEAALKVIAHAGENILDMFEHEVDSFAAAQRQHFLCLFAVN